MARERPGSLPLAELVTRQRGLLSMSLEEMAQRVQKAAESEDEFCAFTRQTIYEIEHGRIPHPRNVRWLAAGLGLPVEQVTRAARQQRMNRRAFLQATAVGAEPGDYGDEVASAAREAEAEQSRLLTEPGSRSIDSLWEGTLEIARAANRGALDLFSASRQIRCHALKLAGQTYRPGALSDLYVIAGQATALMASTAFDLDRWSESAMLARSAVSYATLVGNPSLQAWTLGLAALLANWRNEPDTALGYFGQGLQVAPRGTPRAKLRYIAARSYALLGDASSVARVVGQARRDQDDAERHSDSLCEGIGGEFGFGPARAEACAAAAWLDLGRGHEAKEAAQRALVSLTASPQAVSRSRRSWEPVSTWRPHV